MRRSGPCSGLHAARRPPAQANHPAVVTTFGGCQAFGARILVLEILPGDTLASLVAARGLPQAREAP